MKSLALLLQHLPLTETLEFHKTPWNTPHCRVGERFGRQGNGHGLCFGKNRQSGKVVNMIRTCLLLLGGIFAHDFQKETYLVPPGKSYREPAQDEWLEDGCRGAKLWLRTSFFIPVMNHYCYVNVGYFYCRFYVFINAVPRCNALHRKYAMLTGSLWRCLEFTGKANILPKLILTFRSHKAEWFCPEGGACGHMTLMGESV